MSKLFNFFIAFILLGYTVLNLYATTKLSPTGDELNYYAYAVNIVKGQPQKEFKNGKPVFNTQMPINVLNTLPRVIQQIFSPNLKKDNSSAQQDIINGRVLSVFSSILLAIYVLLWSTQLYGRVAGGLSLLLFCLCPNIMANSQMVGTDVFSFFVATAIMYHLWRYNKTTNYFQLFLVAFFLGLGQLTKQTLIIFYPIVFLFLAIKIVRQHVGVGKKIKQLAIQFLGITLVSLLLINIGFLFYKTGKPLAQYQFASTTFQHIQANFSFAKNIPIPLPEPFIAGFDYGLFNAETPPGNDAISSYGIAYFLNKPVNGQFIWYYYIVCLWYKTPIATIALLLLAVVLFIKNKQNFKFAQNEIYLLLPSIVFLLFLSLTNKMYLGVRSVLLIMPLLFIFIGNLGQTMQKIKQYKWVVFTFLLWQLVSVANYFPHFFPYTNEFIWNKKNAYKTFGDANLYFQEGQYFVKDYLKKNPTIQYEPTSPVKGKVLVSMENYFDYWNTGKMKWLINLHLEPIGHFHSQYLLFDVK
jgi:Dolichyl-phosphate-mannose-protein mannosyltransferase